MNQAVVVSIQVGKPKTMEWVGENGRDRSWTSAIYKTPVTGPIWLGKTNLDGDAQADLKAHGGPNKAVMAYSADHYPFWRETLEQPDLPYGAFGENLTIAGLAEDTVCMDDVYSVGEAVIQVSQPRQPCWKLDRRMGTKKIGPLVIRTGYSGWYFRVLAEGLIQAELPLTLVERPAPEWTIRRCNEAAIRA